MKQDRDTITLSERDKRLFLDALENPLTPNERLQQAFNTYQEHHHKKRSNYLKLC